MKIKTTYHSIHFAPESVSWHNKYGLFFIQSDEKKRNLHTN